MDCHLSDTENFYLIGFFKEPNFGSFYEQLFKHHGYCLWDDEEYEFMQNMRENWPHCCTSSGLEDEKGNILYFDKKPLPDAEVMLGLYTDDRCSVDYTGKKSVKTVVTYYEANYKAEVDEDEGSRDQKRRQNLDVGSLVTYMDEWNKGMATYKQCQPCKAHTIDYAREKSSDDQYFQSKYGSVFYYYKRDDDYYLYDDDGGNNQDDYSSDDSNGNFLCEDDAGYS
jgi:hypothetical protein